MDISLVGVNLQLMKKLQGTFTFAVLTEIQSGPSEFDSPGYSLLMTNYMLFPQTIVIPANIL
jgi:hypothetical protein